MAEIFLFLFTDIFFRIHFSTSPVQKPKCITGTVYSTVCVFFFYCATHPPSTLSVCNRNPQPNTSMGSHLILISGDLNAPTYRNDTRDLTFKSFIDRNCLITDNTLQKPTFTIMEKIQCTSQIGYFLYSNDL